MTILFLLLVIFVVVCVVLAANGKLYKLVDDLRKTIDNATDQRVRQRRETSRRPAPTADSDVTALSKRVEKLEEANRGLESCVETLARTVGEQEKRIRTMESEMAHLSALATEKGKPATSSGTERTTRTANAVRKNTVVDERQKQCAQLQPGKRLYVSSPSGLDPIRFALDDLSEQSQGYFYCLLVKSATKAVLQLNPDIEAMKGFISSLYYQTDCVDVLSRPEGIPQKIVTVHEGELELSGNYWILKQKIQIKIY